MSGWWAVAALVVVAGLKGFEREIGALWRTWRMKRSLRRMRLAIEEQRRIDARDYLEQLDDDTEAHGV